MDDKNKSILLHIRHVEVEECVHSHGENHRDDAVDALAYCTQTVVKKADDEPWDPEKGLAMAIIKKYFGTNKEIKKIILALEK